MPSMYVASGSGLLGAAHDQGGPISISAPPAGHYLISQGFLHASATEIPGDKPSTTSADGRSA
jgi:hypothetical protein